MAKKSKSSKGKARESLEDPPTPESSSSYGNPSTIPIRGSPAQPKMQGNTKTITETANEDTIREELKKYYPMEESESKLLDPIDERKLRAKSHNFQSKDNRKDNNTCLLRLDKEKATSLLPLRKQYQNFDSITKVVTNHFQISNLPPVLYYYSISGIPTTTSTPKKKIIVGTLVNKIVDDHQVSRNRFATNYVDSFFTWNEETFRDLPSPVQIPATINGKPCTLNLTVLRQIDLSTACLSINQQNAREAFNFICPVNLQTSSGTGESTLDTYGVAIKALNTIIFDSARTETDSLASFRIGSNKIFLKRAWRPLTSRNGDVPLFVTHLGFFGTVKPSLGQAIFNYNPATSAFFNPMLLSEWLSHARIAGFAFWKLVKGLKVFTTYRRTSDEEHTQGKPLAVSDMPLADESWTQAHARRIKVITDLGAPCDMQNITHNVNGQYETTTLDKYVKHLGLKELDKPKMPSIKCGSAYYSPEHLWILGYQPLKEQVPSSLTDSMLQHAARPAEQNRDLIVGGLNMLSLSSSTGLNPDNKLPMRIEAKLLLVPSRLLGNPKIVYADGQEIQSRSLGKWDFPGKTGDFFKASQIYPNALNVLYLFESGVASAGQQDPNSRTFYNVTRDQPAFHQAIRQALSQNGGIKLGQAYFATIKNDEELTQAIGVNGQKVDLTVFITNGDKGRYAHFRTMVDRRFGIRAIVVKWAKVEKLVVYEGAGNIRVTPGWIRLLALKINLKWSVNQRVNLSSFFPKDSPETQTIIIGADVTHPSGPPKTKSADKSGSKDTGPMSIAGIVGTMGPWRGMGQYPINSMKYGASARFLKARTEIIEELSEMIMERLRAWRDSNAGRTYPKNIIYFRDGVSASQYRSVIDREITQILRACEKLQIPKPKITAIVATKRHHTRFYPQNPRELTLQNKGGNNPPGTVVESGVTHPFQRDFFLQAQNADGVAGTARPTHYVVLQDDMGWTDHNLQNFVYHLSYTYARSFTSVSYATPAYYADRLCDRLRYYFRRFFDGESGQEKFEDEWKRGNLNWPERKNPWHPRLDNVMFWL